MKKESTFKKILSLYKPYKVMTCLVLFGTLLSSIISIFWPIVTKQILDNCIGQPWDLVKDLMYQCVVILLIMTIGDIVAQWLLSYLASVLTDRIKYNLSRKIFSKYQHMSFSYFDDTRAGGIMTLLDYDIGTLDDFIYSLVTSIIKLIINTIGAVVVFSSLSYKLTLMIVPVLISVVVFNQIHGKAVATAFSKLRNINKSRMENSEDKISGVRTVISFGNEDNEALEYSREADKAELQSKKVWHQTFLRNTVNETFDNILYLIIIVGGTYMIIHKMITVSNLTVFLMYSYMITEPVKSLAGINRMYMKARSSFEHIDEMLCQEPDIKNPQKPLMPKISGKIDIDNVSFRYNNDSDEDVINNLSLSIDPGKFVAIVGPSGSGKSTIAGLIPRYYDVNKGSIKIDGINIKDFDLQYLRRNIGVVQQDVYLFFGSIYDNIAYGCKGRYGIMEDVIKAAKLANAHDFISNLPNGYNSNIGDRGVKLSGGQKQRIAIARIFLENPPIIIFDEATSSLDNDSEREVQKAMENLSKKRTTIVIAHRLSTIKNADEIIYLGEQGIEECGSHGKLMAKEGKYAALYNASTK